MEVVDDYTYLETIIWKKGRVDPAISNRMRKANAYYIPGDHNWQKWKSRLKNQTE